MTGGYLVSMALGQTGQLSVRGRANRANGGRSGPPSGPLVLAAFFVVLVAPLFISFPLNSKTSFSPLPQALQRAPLCLPLCSILISHSVCRGKFPLVWGDIIAKK